MADENTSQQGDDPRGDALPPKAASPPAAGSPTMAAAAADRPTGGGASTAAGTAASLLFTSDTASLRSFPFAQRLVAQMRAGRIAAARDMLSQALKIDIDDPMDQDLGRTCVVDSYISLLSHFTMRHFSDKQLQQLLQLHNDLLNDLAASGTPDGSAPVDEDLWVRPPPVGGEATGAEHSSRAAAAAPSPLTRLKHGFTVKLQKLCSRRQTMVDEKVVTTEQIAEEIPDPVALAQLEAQIATAKKGKGAAAATKVATDAASQVPKITVYRHVTQETIVRHTVDIDPSFAPEEMRAIVEYFHTTLFQHWRLFQFVLTSLEQATRTTHVTLHIEDLPQGLPPLSAAVTAADHERIVAQMHVLDEAAAAMDEEFADADAALQRMRPAYVEETEVAWARHREAASHDMAAAMSPAEYHRAVSVLSTALSATAKRSENSSLTKRIERLEAAAVPNPASPSGPSSGAAGGKAGSKK